MPKKIQAIIVATPKWDGFEKLSKEQQKQCVWRTESSTDLPSDNLGEAAAMAINQAWKYGCDPDLDKLSVVLTFESQEIDVPALPE